MLFKPFHVPLVLNKIKTQTRRFHCPYKVGHLYLAKTKMLSHDYFAKVKILETWPQMLGMISDADCQAEGGYTQETFKQKWIEINKRYNPKQMVWRIAFELDPLGFTKETLEFIGKEYQLGYINNSFVSIYNLEMDGLE